ncbi:DUF3135 domain-containing protein [Candidatus Woesearchaeota archaeon]|nr:DUF3135 domain-containing protein [Candidatus Woesearchaeota archaeon]
MTNDYFAQAATRYNPKDFRKNAGFDFYAMAELQRINPQKAEEVRIAMLEEFIESQPLEKQEDIKQLLQLIKEGSATHSSQIHRAGVALNFATDKAYGPGGLTETNRKYLPKIAEEISEIRCPAQKALDLLKK